LGPFVSYKDNEVLRIRTQASEAVSTKLSVLYLMNGPFKLMLYYARLENLAIDKTSSFLDPFVSYKDNEVLRIRTQASEAINKYLIFFVAYEWAL
jgi:NADH:ubiquinone oxidoreductase subunit C